MSEQLYTLSYISRNAIDRQDVVELNCEIESILKTARRNNALKGVTGALLYSNGCFAQVLEGPLNEIETTFERIQLDTRHRDVRVLQYHPLDRRSFGGWSMAFAGMNPNDSEHAGIGTAFVDPGAMAAGQDGSDFIAVLRDLILRHEKHSV